MVNPKYINIILYSFVRAVYYKPLFACIISILMSLMIDLLFFLFGFVPSGRIGSLIYLCLKGGMFSGVYFLCILAVGHLDEYDKGVFLSTINMFINKLRFVKKSWFCTESILATAHWNGIKPWCSHASQKDSFQPVGIKRC